MILRTVLLSACATAAALAPAVADIVYSPESVSTDMGSASGASVPSNLINQSGLSGNFHGGTTTFDYVTNNLTHNDLPETIWESATGLTSGRLDFDMGAVYRLTQLAFWDTGPLDRAIREFSAWADQEPSFASPQLVGSFVNTAHGPNTLAEVFDIDNVVARYLRIAVASNYGGSSIWMGEIVLGTVAVPEPSLVGWLAAGVLVILVLGRVAQSPSPWRFARIPRRA